MAAISSKEFLKMLGQGGNKPTGKTVDQLMSDKGADKENQKLVELVDMFREVKTNIVDLKAVQEDTAAAKAIEDSPLLSSYFETLQSLEGMIAKLIDPKYKMNKDEAESLRQMINVEQSQIKEIEMSRKINSDFNEEVLKLEKTQGQELFKQGVAEEEQREIEKKLGESNSEMWERIGGNIEFLSTDATQDLGANILDGLGGFEIGVARRLLVPLFQQVKQTDLFKKGQDKLNKLFGRSVELDEEQEGVAAEEGQDQLVDAIEELQVPPISKMRQKARREARVYRNIEGNLTDVATGEDTKETSENIEESNRFLEELQASGKTMEAYLDELRKSAEKDGKIEELREGFGVEVEKEPTSIAEAIEDNKEVFDLLKGIPDSFAELLIMEDKIRDMSEEQVRTMKDELEKDRDAMVKEITKEDIDVKKEQILTTTPDDEMMGRTEEFREDQLELLESVAENTGEKAEKGFNWIAVAIGAIIALMPFLIEWIKKAWTYMKDVFTKTWTWIKETWAKVWEFLKGVPTMLAEGWKKIQDWVGDFVSSIKEGFMDILEKLPFGIGDAIKESRKEEKADEEKERQKGLQESITAIKEGLGTEGLKKVLETLSPEEFGELMAKSGADVKGLSEEELQSIMESLESKVAEVIPSKDAVADLAQASMEKEERMRIAQMSQDQRIRDSQEKKLTEKLGATQGGTVKVQRGKDRAPDLEDIPIMQDNMGVILINSNKI